MSDTITSAEGTTIKYVDVRNGTDVPSYGNIIGCLILETTSNSTQPLIVTHVNGNKITGSRIGTSSGINISANDNIKIRVFYF